MRLADLQREIRDFVVNGDGGPVPQLLVGGRLAENRLAIHRRHYDASLTAAIVGKFPATAWLVGESFLGDAARRFVRARPPQAPCIAEYGQDFPVFLASRPGAENLPYLGSFANLEWHLGQISLAVDRAAIGLSHLAVVDAERVAGARLELQGGLRYLDARWAIDELMKLFLSGDAPDEFELTTGAIWLEARGARGRLVIRRLTPEQFAFRRAVWDGHPLAAAAEIALEAYPSFDPGAALAALVADELVTGIQVPGSRDRAVAGSSEGP